jgi:hypothetical protein
MSLNTKPALGWLLFLFLCSNPALKKKIELEVFVQVFFPPDNNATKEC